MFFPSPVLQRRPVRLPFPDPFPWLPLIPIFFVSISLHSFSALCPLRNAASLGPIATSPRTGTACSLGGRLPPTEASYHQPVGGISPPSQTPTAASKIQLSAERAESHFHHKNARVLPESHTVIGTAWPERSRQLSPWSASRNAGKKSLFISYLGLPQQALGLQNLEIPGKLTLYICLRWRPAWTTMGFGPWPVWSTLFLTEQLSLAVICEVSSWFRSVVCMAALFSGEISMLACFAAEVICRSASPPNCSCRFTVGGGARVLFPSPWWAAAPHIPSRGVKSVKWDQCLLLGTIMRN